jgi:hypothetical protein
MAQVNIKLKEKALELRSNIYSDMHTEKSKEAEQLLGS